MQIFDFNTEKQFFFRWCGKFQSPTPEWMHLTRRLIDFELIVVTDGTLYIAAGINTYTVQKGEYLLMQPTELQYGHQASDCAFYWFHFTYNYNRNDPELIDSDNAGIISPANHLLIPEQSILTSSERIIILMKQLQDSARRYGDTLLNQYLASAILAELSNQSCLFQKYGGRNLQQQLYHDICDYITLHVSENIKVSELASYFGYSKKYLPAFFRKQSGITIKQHMLQTKMEHAKAELSDTNHSISQVAYNIGFNDVHNFSIAFKKITGLSPSNYRNSYNKRNLNN
ncbi:AraC family transcriptional regulator [Anaerocolumna jejuensis]|uniref:AraC family transcriptional regulator n=1 Tax=Anaerocolumna jejuensis TaxID=259063 RepID=UPI003F7C44E3